MNHYAVIQSSISYVVEPESGLSTGAIAGIVVAVVVLLLVVTTLTVLIGVRMYKRAQKKHPTVQGINC